MCRRILWAVRAVPIPPPPIGEDVCDESHDVVITDDGYYVVVPIIIGGAKPSRHACQCIRAIPTTTNNSTYDEDDDDETTAFSIPNISDK